MLQTDKICRVKSRGILIEIRKTDEAVALGQGERKRARIIRNLKIGVQAARLDSGWCQDDMHP